MGAQHHKSIVVDGTTITKTGNIISAVDLSKSNVIIHLPEFTTTATSADIYFTGKFKKQAGVDTITFYCELQSEQNGFSGIGTFTIDSISDTVSKAGLGYSAQSVSLDVSSLTDGNTYDFTVSLHATGGAGATSKGVTGIGS